MKQIYGQRWLSQEGEIKNSRGSFCVNFLVWCEKTETLTDQQWWNGVRSAEMAVTFAAMRGETAWPPTYAEFLGNCRSGGFEICTNAQDALWDLQRIMAQRGVARDWSLAHPAVYWAYKKLDWYVLQQQKPDEQLRVFSRVWNEALKMAAEGFQFPVPPVSVNELPCLPASKEFSAEKISSLKKIFE